MYIEMVQFVTRHGVRVLQPAIKHLSAKRYMKSHTFYQQKLFVKKSERFVKSINLTIIHIVACRWSTLIITQQQTTVGSISVTDQTLAHRQPLRLIFGLNHVVHAFVLVKRVLLVHPENV